MIITDRVLDRAVATGLIAQGQALALRSLARQEAEADPRRPEPADAEALRFVSGFADIFVTIGLALFLGAGAYLGGRSLAAGWTSAGVAAAAWLLAEFFTRRRRMALPSIVLLVVFAFSSFVALAELLGAGPASGGGVRLGWLRMWWLPGGDPLPLAGAALGTVVATALHYWRFRVPITVAAGVAALALSVLLVLSAAAPELIGRIVNGVLLGLGLATFALAMAFDLRDPARVTRRTDIAFWLHLLASPLIVHSVFQALGAGGGQISPAVSAVVLLVFAALGLVAVLVDRRALLVSGLVYAGLAFGSLFRQAGIVDRSLPYTLLALGALVLLLSAGWAPLRRALLGLVPAGLAERLPRPIG